ncbi:thiaminase II, partial [Halomonas litopenaei]|nr:thiaminase II [Halomonas litopenaei]
MTGSVYGETFAHWRAGCPGPWRDYTHHAFVEGLRNGSLSRASFLHYLVQDYVFLVHFARAWSLAVVKAETLDEMKICAGTVDALVNHEMALHVTTCAAQGIDEAALFGAVEEFENLAYTRYVMDAGLQGDFLDLMAALA